MNPMTATRLRLTAGKLVRVSVAAVSERPVYASVDVAKFIDALTEGRTDVVVLRTGVSVNELVRMASRWGAARN